MFITPFSFEGRIRRTEYGLSCIMFGVAAIIMQSLIAYMYFSQQFELIALAAIIGIIAYWFLVAQGAKRCHDVGNSGWWQLIPFYGLYLLFADGQLGRNRYGDNPKNFVSLNEPIEIFDNETIDDSHKNNEDYVDNAYHQSIQSKESRRSTHYVIVLLAFLALVGVPTLGYYLHSKGFHQIENADVYIPDLSDEINYFDTPTTDSLSNEIEYGLHGEDDGLGKEHQGSPVSASSTVKSNSSGLSYLKNSHGHYPSDIGLLENGTLKNRMIALMGDSVFTFLVEVWAVESPIEIANNVFVAKGCQAHYCSETNFIIIYELKSDLLTIGTRTEGEINFYTEATDIPTQYWDWRNSY